MTSAGIDRWIYNISFIPKYQEYENDIKTQNDRLVPMKLGIVYVILDFIRR